MNKRSSYGIIIVIAEKLGAQLLGEVIGHGTERLLHLLQCNRKIYWGKNNIERIRI